MGIQYLYDDGYPPSSGKKRQYPEDGLVFCPDGNGGGTYGVLDGVSFYPPRTGPPLYDGLTQGMIATRVVAATFLNPVSEGMAIPEILEEANRVVLEEAVKVHGLSLEEPELQSHFS